MPLVSWKLPFQFDVERLRHDLGLIAEAEWIGHFNTAFYDGDWSAVPLRSVDGRSDQIVPDPTKTTEYADTPILQRCAYFRSVLATLACPLEAVRLMRLRAGSAIHEHRDFKLDLDDGVIRIHIPIVTDPAVRFFLNGRHIPMLAGEVWYTNVNLPHRVENESQIDRVHLVIDALVNDWVRHLLAQATPRATDDVTFWHSELSAQAKPAAPQKRTAKPVIDPRPPVNPELVAQIVAFLGEIGIPARFVELPKPTFLPGIKIRGGELLIDQSRLRYPGDLLHEAGHIAVADPDRRSGMRGNISNDPTEELMALAWSYAAACHLQIDPAIVFHADGYKGGGQNLIENFTQGNIIGLPMLQWLGMTCDPRRAQELGVAPFPHMLNWLRPVRAPVAEVEA